MLNKKNIIILVIVIIAISAFVYLYTQKIKSDNLKAINQNFSNLSSNVGNTNYNTGNPVIPVDHSNDWLRLIGLI